MNSGYRYLTILLPLMAFIVITVGAYVRLTDAGLGCPDWPGCYGELVPSQQSTSAGADASPEFGKAWREMIHRYIAAGLGLGIVLLFICSYGSSRRKRHTGLLGLLVVLVIFQGLLGMWTVTLLLKPLVVTAHLFGGLATLALLWWHFLASFYPATVARYPRVPYVNLLILVLLGQIFLGGWTSTNYAALACTDFPTCHGVLWPDMNFQEAFVLWRGLGVNYEYGVLDSPARTAIHYSHRLWALVTAISLIFGSWMALQRGSRAVRKAAWCIITLLCAQLGLGISNVLFGLPLAVAVAHNGVAALLLLSVISLKYFNKEKAN